MNRTLSIVSWSVLRPGEAPDVSFVPPILRRRLSPLQRIAFSLLGSAGAGKADELVFASRDGEDTLTRRIVSDFKADGSVSPHRFSTSVYNAAPGLWSVFTGNRSAYTAVAAGEDTIECGLLEALDARGCTFVFAEETSGGFGLAVRLAEDGLGRRVSFEESSGGGSIRFETLVDFLVGRTRELNGRWIRLREERC